MSRINIIISIIILFINQCIAEKNLFDYHRKIGIGRAETVKFSEGIIGRIIGGTPSELGTFPFHAGLIITLEAGEQSICGGSLISNTRVLTAAHCWWDGVNRGGAMTVVLGSKTIFSGGTRIAASSVINHNNWNPRDIVNDIAMVIIGRVTFNNQINIINLPSTSDGQNNFAGLNGVASGFGKTSDGNCRFLFLNWFPVGDHYVYVYEHFNKIREHILAQNNFPPTTHLRHVTLPIITNNECQKSFNIKIHDSHLCTSGSGNKGTCDGDSGGPLSVMHNKVRILVGLVSFGMASGCERGYPSVFTRITTFLPWIQNNMK